MFVKVRETCNWVQGLEGVIDTAHSNILHTNGIKPAAVGDATVGNDDGASLRPSADPAPRIECESTSYGFRYAAIRRPLVDADTRDYVRVSLFIAPFFAFFPNPVGWQYMQAFIPIDDEHTTFLFAQAKLDGPIDERARQARLKRAGMQIGIDLDNDYRKTRTRENNWQQDRAAMQAGDFTGIHGVNNEDIAVQESMGPLYDRTKEHLGASDTAVIRMRRIMLDGLQRFMRGAPPVGLAEPVTYETLHAEERMIPKGSAWQGELVG
jgi:phthalate 4,5-dioxygenase oxygenase subunit